MDDLEPVPLTQVAQPQFREAGIVWCTVNWIEKRRGQDQYPARSQRVACLLKQYIWFSYVFDYFNHQYNVYGFGCYRQGQRIGHDIYSAQRELARR